jgi:hypothetical protein
MRIDPTHHILQTLDRHNRKIEELTARVKELKAKLGMVEAIPKRRGRPPKTA